MFPLSAGGYITRKHHTTLGEHARAGRRRPRFFVKEDVFAQNSSETDEKVQQQHESGSKGMSPRTKTSGKNKRGERGSTDDEILNVSTWRTQTSNLQMQWSRR